MRERPILMNGAMVRAVLDSRKTQTRRIIKPVQPRDDGRWPAGRDPAPDCPHGVAGDRLWVREAWQHYDWSEEGEPCLRYQADGATAWPEVPDDETAELLNDRWAGLSEPDNYRIDNAARDRRWRPSIHMPRWASRITLEIADVRVQRLQEISEKDAEAEGVQTLREDPRVALGGGFSHQQVYRRRFAELWDSINGAGAWAANPWVWAISFRRLP
jgi:hypothetical protein